MKKIFLCTMLLLAGIVVTDSAIGEFEKKPDLIISSGHLVPAAPTEMDELRVEGIRYKNIGDAYVPDGSEISLKCRLLRKDKTFVKEYEIFPFSYYGLAPGLETTSFNFYIGKVKPGEYVIELTCDCLSKVNEVTKNNNIMYIPLTVSEAKR